jgi:hypothetical protein
MAFDDSVVFAQTLQFPPAVQSQIVALLADALVSDYKEFPTIPR